MVSRPAKLRILLADDHSVVRDGLNKLIDGQPDMGVVGEAADGHTAVRLAQELVPDVAVVDVSMPGLDGAQVTRIIADTCPHVRVIAFTRHDDGSIVHRLFAAGATGYVLKQSPSSELTRGIRAVARGERYIDRSLSPLPGTPAERAATPEAAEDLTLVEERVLGMIALGHSQRDIADSLAMELPQLLSIRAAAMTKTGLTTRASVVRYAQDRGWLGRG